MSLWLFFRKPRVCGEKQAGGNGARTGHRITPAYAGKSGFRAQFYVCHWDHPRVCGEKSNRVRRYA